MTAQLTVADLIREVAGEPGHQPVEVAIAQPDGVFLVVVPVAANDVIWQRSSGSMRIVARLPDEPDEPTAVDTGEPVT